MPRIPASIALALIITVVGVLYLDLPGARHQRSSDEDRISVLYDSQ